MARIVSARETRRILDGEVRDGVEGVRRQRDLERRQQQAEGSSGLSLGVTPRQVDLHLEVGAQWPDREDVHAAHTLQIA